MVMMLLLAALSIIEELKTEAEGLGTKLPVLIGAI